jgi:hypothetical protein
VAVSVPTSQLLELIKINQTAIHLGTGRIALLTIDGDLVWQDDLTTKVDFGHTILDSNWTINPLYVSFETVAQAFIAGQTIELHRTRTDGTLSLTKVNQFTTAGLKFVDLANSKFVIAD